MKKSVLLLIVVFIAVFAFSQADMSYANVLGALIENTDMDKLTNNEHGMFAYVSDILMYVHPLTLTIGTYIAEQDLSEVLVLLAPENELVFVVAFSNYSDSLTEHISMEDFMICGNPIKHMYNFEDMQPIEEIMVNPKESASFVLVADKAYPPETSYLTYKDHRFKMDATNDYLKLSVVAELYCLINEIF